MRKKKKLQNRNCRVSKKKKRYHKSFSKEHDIAKFQTDLLGTNLQSTIRSSIAASEPVRRILSLSICHVKSLVQIRITSVSEPHQTVARYITSHAKNFSLDPEFSAPCTVALPKVGEASLAIITWHGILYMNIYMLKCPFPSCFNCATQLQSLGHSPSQATQRAWPRKMRAWS